ncbi:type IV toxin-antitoxin system AbiEi family antitoxin domain-containing protein [Corynebacterium cystitidis]|uniref:Transcriptional regulator, AbiEi antitoxin, Type IV TA system n=1 Tax=Corynebacterium cystitidis DSM 20524 TaxID=1121357 RepID=A0A1H9SM74_9CORY|nr:type IV toxin-antitoxin system AbiEi family antitoxin domain-containing protein [Corynebacterium cystitidis]WJY83080.1 hypothetical protein CCYS_10905 [Corynebacterium cystitidis DSM 20524]SER85483.1 Transcriptional regulator, AbiEi antitoxin, Type IV TA system [Corynebacterium cystitidis DSM 20524]SNV65984.1 Uncharacterised protein [Corynebacterium cystitidis]
MKITEATEIVLDLASQQWGMVTTAQAKKAGVPAVMLGRLVDKAVLERVRSGVYVSTSAGWSAATEIRAQWLALEPTTMAADRLQTGPIAVVSHESAAELHRIGDLDSPHICFTVPSRRQTRQPEVIFRIAELDDADWTVVDGLPVTTAVRTLIDLARAGHEPEHLTDVIGDIFRRRTATHTEITDALVDIAEILAITPATAEGAQAWLEERFPTPAPSPQSARILQETMAHAQASLPEPSPQQMRIMQESMEKVLAPLQKQLGSVLDAITAHPAVLCLLAQAADDGASRPALRQVVDAAKAYDSVFDGLPAHLFPNVDRQDPLGGESNQDEDADE